MARGHCTSSLEIKSACYIIKCISWARHRSLLTFRYLFGRFLAWAFEVTKNSLLRAEEEALDKDTGREQQL